MKTYIIDEKEFTLKPHGEVTLDESDKITEIISGFSGEGDTIVTNFNSKQLKTFLSIVLVSKEEIADLNFGKAKNEVALEIIKDFFLDRIASFQDIMKPLQI